MNDFNGGFVLIKPDQLIDRSYHQEAHVFTYGERPQLYQSDH
jgi:hypothetical protein